jgi:hypothetical protein
MKLKSIDFKPNSINRMFYPFNVQFKKLKMAVFWVVLPCSLVQVYLMMEAANTSETSVKFY